jgi:hypothetical protein
MRKKKFDTIRFINRSLDRAIDKAGKAMAPRKQPRGRSFFDIFMDEATGAPKRRW